MSSNTQNGDFSDSPKVGNADLFKTGTMFSIVGDGSKTFESLCQKAGFDCYAIVDISHVQNGQIRPVILQNNLLPDLLQMILSSGEALGQCTVFEALMQSTRPFSWRTRHNAVTGEKSVPGERPTDDMFDKLLEAFNIFYGRCVSVNTNNQKQYVVVFMGSSEVEEKALAALDKSSIREFTRLFGSGKNFNAPNSVSLSDIELYCCQLLAEGYSPSEIAEKNNITDHTLNLIFDNVCRKLSAATLAHALLLLFISDMVSA